MLKVEPEPEPGHSDGSGSSQIPRLRLRNPDFEDCIFIAKNTGGSKFRDKFDLLITDRADPGKIDDGSDTRSGKRCTSMYRYRIRKKYRY